MTYEITEEEKKKWIKENPIQNSEEVLTNMEEKEDVKDPDINKYL